MPEKHAIEEIIVRYLEQDVSDEELRALDAWLQESEENKDCLFQFKQICDLTRNFRVLSEEDINKSWQKMEQKLPGAPRAEAPAGNSRKRRPFRGAFLPALRYAAVGIAAVLAGLFIGRQGSLAPEAPEAERFNELSVQKGSKPGRLSLSDGSLVSVNAAGVLRYPSRFAEGAREVYLEGEAYFEVAPDAEKNFIVRLRQQDVLVYGTHFSIEAYPDEPYSLVTLLNGSLGIETRNEKGDRINHTLLKPGQKALFDRIHETVSVEQADTLLARAWMKGEYKFKNELLGAIVKRLENYYDLAFHWEDEEAKYTRYTGSFSLDQDIQSVLNVINYEKQFVFRRNGKDIYIQ
jgi:ferric-dicitrate binding protein FerR (iron transport regulator)